MQHLLNSRIKIKIIVKCQSIISLHYKPLFYIASGSIIVRDKKWYEIRPLVFVIHTKHGSHIIKVSIVLNIKS